MLSVAPAPRDRPPPLFDPRDRRIEKQPGKEGPVALAVRAEQREGAVRHRRRHTALIMLCHCEFRYGQVDLLCREGEREDVASSGARRGKTGACIYGDTLD